VSEPYISEIRMFGGTFAPRGWAFCDGQLLAISSNDALFSLVGTIYGGDGRTTFGLPDLRGRVPIHLGQGPGLANYRQGALGGQEEVTLVATQTAHQHPLAAAATATSPSPGAALPATVSTSARYAVGEPVDAALNANAVSSAGGSRPHDNLAPFECVSYIIALFGVYPSRS
jgi:microcystin-dependent protein